MNTIGNNIREARKALKMSQDDLAEAIGANRVTISKYENGSYLPSVPALDRLAVALHTTANALQGKPDPISAQDSEIWQLRERLRRDPDMRMLFSAADRATPEHLRAAAAMLKALEPTEGEAE